MTRGQATSVRRLPVYAGGRLLCVYLGIAVIAADHTAGRLRIGWLLYLTHGSAPRYDRRDQPRRRRKRRTRRNSCSTPARWTVSVPPTACIPRESSRRAKPYTNWRTASRWDTNGLARVAVMGQEIGVEIILGPDDAEPILSVVALENIGSPSIPIPCADCRTNH